MMDPSQLMTPIAAAIAGQTGALWGRSSSGEHGTQGDMIVIFEDLLKRAKETVQWVGERSPGLANDMFLGKHFRIIYDVMKCAEILAEVGE